MFHKLRRPALGASAKINPNLALLVEERHLVISMIQKTVIRREQKITGLSACHLALQTRFSDAIRLYVTDQNLPYFKEFLRELAISKKAYHIVSAQDLQKITDGSTHHEGVCLILKSRVAPALTSLLSDLSQKKQDGLGSQAESYLYLERVENPHNLGAICRVAAHFGVKALLVEGDATIDSALQSAAYFRVAEGGAEFVPSYPVVTSSVSTHQSGTTGTTSRTEVLK